MPKKKPRAGTEIDVMNEHHATFPATVSFMLCSYQVFRLYWQISKRGGQ